MQPDNYTKAVLTVIAVMLSVTVVKPLVSPTIADAQAQHMQSVSPPKAPQESTKVAWEYKMIDLSRRTGGFGLQDYSDMLEDGVAIPGIDWLTKAEQLGEQGWELVTVVPASNLSGQNFAGATSEMMFLFKRRIH
jgi:hypothetical protein